jgi:perosamine synthetase
MLNIFEFCIEDKFSIVESLKVIDQNAHGIAFVVDASGRLCGSLSDGDIRRALIRGAEKNSPILEIYNRDVVSLHYKSFDSDIQKLLSDKVKFVPLVDDDRVIRDIASNLHLHNFSIMEPLLGGRELEYVTDCIKTNWISSQGKYVSNFEESLANKLGVPHCLVTSNGTTALHLALTTLDIGIGDEVIVPNLTFGASVNSIMHSGAMPVLVDVEYGSWNLSPSAVRSAITPKTKAIMPVHLYGNPCDMNEIMSIAREFNLKIIEDCAEAFCSSINGRAVGSFGDAAAFSFFANKIITCGEGGAVIFKDTSNDNKARVLRDHGMSKSKKFWHEAVGYNYRLTNIQAAIGCAQLEQVDYFIKRRMEIFAIYDNLLLASGLIERQKQDPNNINANWLYTFCLNKDLRLSRDNLIDTLKSYGIETRPVFYPMNQMPSFLMAKSSSSLNVSIDISYRGLSIPSSVTLKNDEVEYISNKILRLIKD